MEKRPDNLPSKTTQIKTGHGTLYLTISYKDEKPFEIFCTIGKSGRELTALAEAIGRLCSLWLRSGGNVKDLSEQLKGIGGESPLPNENGLVLSIPDAIGQLLEKE